MIINHSTDFAPKKQPYHRGENPLEISSCFLKNYFAEKEHCTSYAIRFADYNCTKK